MLRLRLTLLATVFICSVAEAKEVRVGPATINLTTPSGSLRQTVNPARRLLARPGRPNVGLSG